MLPKLKLLIIEDEQAILQGLTDVFVFHGFEVDSAQLAETMNATITVVNKKPGA